MNRFRFMEKYCVRPSHFVNTVANPNLPSGIGPLTAPNLLKMSMRFESLIMLKNGVVIFSSNSQKEIFVVWHALIGLCNIIDVWLWKKSTPRKLCPSTEIVFLEGFDNIAEMLIMLHFTHNYRIKDFTMILVFSFH